MYNLITYVFCFLYLDHWQVSVFGVNSYYRINFIMKKGGTHESADCYEFFSTA